MWKIFKRLIWVSEVSELLNMCEFYAVFVPNEQWKFSWCINREGDFSGEYWDKETGQKIKVTWEKFSTGESAANYIKETIRKSGLIVSDVTRDYLK